MKLGKLQIHGGTVTNIIVDLVGKNGLFTLKSLNMDLYQGRINATGTVNVQKKSPVTAANLAVEDVHAAVHRIEEGITEPFPEVDRIFIEVENPTEAG